MRANRTLTDLSGNVIVRMFEYEKNDNPTIIGYIYGSIEIVRPVLVVGKKGSLMERYEVATMNISDNETFMLTIKNAEESKIKPFLNHLVTDNEFEKLDRIIVKSI
jgi:hypothetical protein